MKNMEETVALVQDRFKTKTIAEWSRRSLAVLVFYAHPFKNWETRSHIRKWQRAG